MVEDFWKNKKVLITGDSGFKGSWLTCLLLKFGCKVYGLSLPIDNTFILNQELIKDENFNSKKNLKHYEHHDLDIRDRLKLKNFVSDLSPDIIFHMAAIARIQPSFKDPLSYFETNATGTMKIAKY